MECLSIAEESMIKDKINLLRPKKKKVNYTTIKDISNLSRLQKETKAVKDRILRD